MVKTLRGMNAEDAMMSLKFHSSKTARLLYKVIHSAVANATNNYNLKSDNLKIKTITVDTGPTMKRYWFRSHGSADPLLKRSSHFSVVVDEIKPTLVKKPVAKPTTTTTPTSKTSDNQEPASGSPVATPKNNLPKPKLAGGLKKVLTRRTTNK